MKLLDDETIAQNEQHAAMVCDHLSRAIIRLECLTPHALNWRDKARLVKMLRLVQDEFAVLYDEYITSYKLDEEE